MTKSIHEERVILWKIMKNNKIPQVDKYPFRNLSNKLNIHRYIDLSLDKFDERQLQSAVEKLQKMLEKEFDKEKKYGIPYKNKEQNKYKKIVANIANELNINRIKLNLVKGRFETRYITPVNRTLQEFTNDPMGFLGKYKRQNSEFINDVVRVMYENEALNVIRTKNGNGYEYDIYTNKISNNLKRRVKNLIIEYHPRLK